MRRMEVVMGRASRVCAAAGLAITLATVVVPAQVGAAVPSRGPAAVSTRGVSSSGLARARAQLPMLQQRGSHGMMATRAGEVTASQAAPAGAVSSNVQFLANLPIPSAIALAFIGNTVFVSTVLGVYSVDISDPTNPRLLGSIPMYIWENEHMTADPARNLIFIARDPRGFTTPATTAFPYGATHIIDVSNPSAMTEVSFHTQPTGHTAACINNCTFLWVAGPASPAIAVQSGADPSWGGRPMWGIDITDPAHPVDCPHFIDLNNHDGRTDYDHDVDLDATGIAWISGSGHVRGFWTSGQHLNPVSGRVETATACDPIPAGGGNTNEGQISVQGGVIHNSFRNMTLAVDGRKGDVHAATEEVTTSDCAESGRFVTYDLAGSMQGQDWTSPPSKPYVLPRLGVWTPQGQPGSTGCDSSHWFTDRGDGLVAIAFYTQGTRILDTRDPRHVRQVGYYNVADLSGASTNNAWASYWHGDNYIYVADFERGLDVLRFTGAVDAAAGPAVASTARPSSAAGERQRVLPNTSAGVAALLAERPTPATITVLMLLPMLAVGAWIMRRQ
ncbi:MAG: LVIVD repeat-containing protein [Candidatus Dormibacteria bacterium]